MIMTTRHPYPKGIDFVWIGADKSGQAAVFVTAGTAPIPISILQGDIAPENIEELINKMPKYTERSDDSELPYAESFDNFVERGFFVFDWTDIHRTRAHQTGMYQRVSAPRSSIDFKDIPLYISSVARISHFSDILFNRTSQIDITKYHQYSDGNL